MELLSYNLVDRARGGNDGVKMARVGKYIASESGRSSHGLLYGEIRRARKGVRKTDFLVSLT